MNLTFTIPRQTPSQNEYMRWHFRKRSKYKHDLCRIIQAKLAVLGLFGIKKPDNRALVRITRHSAGQLDRGNFVGGCKALLDALVLCNVIHDDSERWVDDTYVQMKSTRKDGRTVVEVER